MKLLQGVDISASDVRGVLQADQSSPTVVLIVNSRLVSKICDRQHSFFTVQLPNGHTADRSRCASFKNTNVARRVDQQLITRSAYAARVVVRVCAFQFRSGVASALRPSQTEISASPQLSLTK